jgi:branched-chain amino acid aminotransferase
MAIQEAELIWKNGALIPWRDATTHVMSHALHYGSAVFEGLRAYKTSHAGSILFRAREHMERLLFSASVYRLDIPHDVDALIDICRHVVSANKLDAAYVRPIAYLGYGDMGPASLSCPTDFVVAAFPWGTYLGEDGLRNGIDAGVSSWRRLAPGTLPTGVKAAGNYLSSRLISMEARARGFDEGIGLAHEGTVSEGSNVNIFAWHGGRLMTPPAASSILAGITRDTVMCLARDLDLAVVEQALPRELLYAADEVFVVGTAAEITPLRSVDGIRIGSGHRPVTTRLQERFFGLFDGSTSDDRGWLTAIK